MIRRFYDGHTAAATRSALQTKAVPPHRRRLVKLRATRALVRLAASEFIPLSRVKYIFSLSLLFASLSGQILLLTAKIKTSKTRLLANLLEKRLQQQEQVLAFARSHLVTVVVVSPPPPPLASATRKRMLLSRCSALHYFSTCDTCQLQPNKLIRLRVNLPAIGETGAITTCSRRRCHVATKTPLLP